MVCNVTAGLTNGASDTLAQNEAISDTFGHFLHSVQHITTSRVHYIHYTEPNLELNY